jgi:hypothetical protein
MFPFDLLLSGHRQSVAIGSYAIDVILSERESNVAILLAPLGEVGDRVAELLSGRSAHDVSFAARSLSQRNANPRKSNLDEPGLLVKRSESLTLSQLITWPDHLSLPRQYGHSGHGSPSG